MIEMLSRQYAEPLFKLVSRQDTLLGTITIPHRWAEALDRARYFEFHAQVELKDRYLIFDSLDSDRTCELRRGVLTRRTWGEFRGALELYGITPEEFEKLPGCTFQPGAGYIRSLIGKD